MASSINIFKSGEVAREFNDRVRIGENVRLERSRDILNIYLCETRMVKLTSWGKSRLCTFGLK